MVRKLFLVCGILSSLLYVAMNVIGAVQFEGYSSVSQTVSELFAIGAPSRPLWLVLGLGYDVLVLAFGLGVWASAGGKRALRIVGGLLVAYSVVGLAGPFAPMHLRGQEISFTDTMHIILTMVLVLLILLAIGFGATAFGKRFRYYSIATIVVFLVFGALTGLDAPRIQANLPTPLVGVWERISLAGFLIWIVVLAIILWREEKGQSRIDGREG